jgi:biotin carboxyl carrier protein
MRYYVTVGEVEEILEVEAIGAARFRVVPLSADGTPQGTAAEVTLENAGPALLAEIQTSTRDGAALAATRCFVSQGSNAHTLDITTAASRSGATLSSQRERTLENLGRARNQRSGAASIKAPMPGRVVRILTSEGASVEAGQALIAIEAMKMENELLSERAGVVQRIFVNAGDSVEGGAELLRLSDAPSA